jgi:hypothetical protein
MFVKRSGGEGILTEQLGLGLRLSTPSADMISDVDVRASGLKLARSWGDSGELGMSNDITSSSSSSLVAMGSREEVDE